MAFIQKPNEGSLFKNEKKSSANHPDYTGTLNVNGASMRLSAWKNTSKGGKTYLKISVSEEKALADNRRTKEYDELAQAGQSLARPSRPPMPARKPVWDDSDDEIF